MSKKQDKNDIAELGEPLVDELSRDLFEKFIGEALPELVGDIPMGKFVLSVARLFGQAKSYHRTKFLLAFLEALKTGEKTMDNFEELPVDDQNALRGLVIAQLDFLTDERQAEAIALITGAYLSKKIDRVSFQAILFEIKNMNPTLFYFGENIITTKIQDTGLAKGQLVAEGATHLIPPAFGRSTVTDIGMWGSTGTYIFSVTELGKLFLEYMYEPLSKKYN